MIASAYRILVVDDDPNDRDALRSLILKDSSDEYHVSVADDGEAGIRHFLAESPDCVLVSYHLPDMNGEEFLIRLRELSGASAIAMVFLIGKDEQMLEQPLVRQGTVACLYKEWVTVTELSHAIHNAIEKAQLQRKVERNRRLLEIQNTALLRTELQFRVLIEQAPIRIAMFDNRMNYLATSSRWLSDYGGAR
jgi:CheY-like chemotaxis protein